MPNIVYREDFKALITRLRKLRLAAGLQQADVAKAMGRSQSYVSDIEIGKRRLDVMYFIDFCFAVGASPSDVIAEVTRGHKRRPPSSS